MSTLTPNMPDPAEMPPMDYLAQINADGVVVNTVTVPAGQGSDYMEALESGRWIPIYPSDETKAGLNRVGIGSIYMEGLGGFVTPQPFPSWKLNESTFLWEAPSASPSPGHEWDEQALAWYFPPHLIIN